ncbi:MAG: SH3 domain-containing protein [Alphaproteobacteria bacterium]
MRWNILTRGLAVAAMTVVLAVPGTLHAEKALPVDEATKDQALVQMRAALIDAVQAKDLRKVMSFMAPTIELSFGGLSGPAAFAQLVRQDPKLWGELLTVLKRGGRFDPDGNFVAPYAFDYPCRAVDCGVGGDEFNIAIVVEHNANLHVEPDRISRIITPLSYDIVRVLDWGGEDKDDAKTGWIKVRTADGKEGFVRRAAVYAALDYRAGFQKIDGQWKMIFFVVGD